MVVGNIYVEVTVSQNVFLRLSFYLCKTMGNFLYVFLNIFFQNFMKNELGRFSKI